MSSPLESLSGPLHPTAHSPPDEPSPCQKKTEQVALPLIAALAVGLLVGALVGTFVHPQIGVITGLGSVVAALAIIKIAPLLIAKVLQYRYQCLQEQVAKEIAAIKGLAKPNYDQIVLHNHKIARINKRLAWIESNPSSLKLETEQRESWALAQAEWAITCAPLIGMDVNKVRQLIPRSLSHSKEWEQVKGDLLKVNEGLAGAKWALYQAIEHASVHAAAKKYLQGELVRTPEGAREHFVRTLLYDSWCKIAKNHQKDIVGRKEAVEEILAMSMAQVESLCTRFDAHDTAQTRQLNADRSDAPRVDKKLLEFYKRMRAICFMESDPNERAKVVAIICAFIQKPQPEPKRTIDSIPSEILPLLKNMDVALWNASDKYSLAIYQDDDLIWEMQQPLPTTWQSEVATDLNRSDKLLQIDSRTEPSAKQHQSLKDAWGYQSWFKLDAIKLDHPVSFYSFFEEVMDKVKDKALQNAMIMRYVDIVFPHMEHLPQVRGWICQKTSELALGDALRQHDAENDYLALTSDVSQPGDSGYSYDTQKQTVTMSFSKKVISARDNTPFYTLKQTVTIDCSKEPPTATLTSTRT